MVLTPGTRLVVSEVTAPLGEGGMTRLPWGDNPPGRGGAGRVVGIK